MLGSLESETQNETELEALKALLGRNQQKKLDELREKHTRKLVNIYGPSILLKQQRDSVINLSDVAIEEELRKVMTLGINFHVKGKFEEKKRKVEVEVFYENVREKVRSNDLTIAEEDAFKCELERFGTKRVLDRTQDIITRDQYRKIKEFRSDPRIAIRKSDKGSNFVILNKQYYEEKMDEIVSDESKFKKLESDPTEDLKRDLNKLVNKANRSGDPIKLSKKEGKYTPGYLYGNPKIHKSLRNPPLRPIISQVGTVTYDTCKELNKLITPYIPQKYSIKSTNEFISLVKNCGEAPQMASLDVESLFTNVPVMQTIEIILNNVYSNQSMPPPKIERDVLKELLILCTTRTPFTHVNGDLYEQCDGVSMGSCLGPTFAEFYMCDLENRFFERFPGLKPKLYTRYVDDIFMVVEDQQIIEEIKTELSIMSVLNFTHEIEKDNRLAFLDCLSTKLDNRIVTSVYVKETSGSDVLNYKSICPQRYKTGLIKTLLHRGWISGVHRGGAIGPWPPPLV